MKPKISIITLGVSNFQKSLSFYRDGLGFKPHNYKEGEEHIMFKMKGTWLSLFPISKLAKDATVKSNHSGFCGFTLAHNTKSEDEVNKVYQEALQAGAKAVKEPSKVFWGGYSGYFADPDGYLWEVAYNPFTNLT
jgi:uncharacterized protein